MYFPQPGGIVAPHDGNCHLDDKEYYSHSLNQDYPSVAQINSKIRENQIYTIFAVTEFYLGLYKQLSERISGSAAAEMQADSQNVVTLVKENYRVTLTNYC